MADVSGKFFSAKKVRTGVSPSSPGVEQGETLPPVNPPGTSLNSVGLTMPSAFAVANSPLTSNGTIAVTGAGTVGQYVRGDGSLADFPESSGGGSSVSYYLNGSVSQGTIGGVAYLEMNKVPILGAGTDFTRNSNGYIASFITDAGDPNLLEIPGGNWNFESYFSASSGGGSPTFYVELYKVNSGGTATLIASNSANPELISFGTTIAPYFSSLAVPTTVLALTDRLAVRYYVTPGGRTLTLHTEGPHLCQIITTFTTGLTALNGLTSQVQFFAVGTSGTDFNIASATATHTFNLPTASASNRGALSSADWTTFNNKENAITAGTTAQYYRGDKTFQTLNTSVVPELTNLYYTEARVNANANVAANTAARHNAVTLGTANGLSLSTQQLSLGLASAGVTGALSGTDWSTFNSKQQALNGTGFVKISGTTISYDNSTYLTTSAAASTYLALAGGTMTGNINWTANDVGLTWSRNTDGAAIKFISVGDGTGESYLQIGTSDNGNEAIVFTQTSLIRVQIDTDGLLKNGSSQRYVFENGGTWGIAVTNGVVTTGSYANPSWITSLDWSKIISRPTTLAGYGITDAVPSNRTITINGTTLDLSANRTYNVGTVTNVTASSPLFSSGGATPNITIQQASGSQNGFLSSSDWTTFNNKQNALTNPVTGTGTSGQVAYFNGTSSITGEANLFWDATNDRLGIGTATPLSFLDISSGTTTDIIRFGASSRWGFRRENNDNRYVAFYRGLSSTPSAVWTVDGDNGNLGLGVTPSAGGLSGYVLFELANGGASIYSGPNQNLNGSNISWSGGTASYKISNFATLYNQQSGQHQWFTAPSGTAGNAITFTQAMTLTNNGNLLVGTTTDAGYKLDVNGAGRFLSGSSSTIGLIVGGAGGAGSTRQGQLRFGDAGSVYKIQGGEDYSAFNFMIGSGTPLSLASNGAATFSSSVTASKFTSIGSTSYTNDFVNTNIGTVGQTVGLRFGYDGSTYNKGAVYFISKSANGVGDLIFALNNSESSANVSTSDERMRITSSGNVGIGTNTPQDYSGFNTLTINGKSGSNGGVLRLTAFDNSSSFNIYAAGSAVNFNTTSAIPFIWYTQDTERMRITSTGFVSVGATTNGRLGVRGFTNDSSGYAFEAANSSGNTLFITRNDGASSFFGNVGIGTLSFPNGESFLIQNNGVWNVTMGLNNTGTGGRQWNIFSTNTTFSQGAGKLLFYNTTGGSNAMVIDSSNNVGIGTTSPTKKLHVASSENEGIYMQGTSSGGHWFNFSSASSNLWSMGAQTGLMGWYNRTDSTYKMVITDGGNVLIGTTTDSGGKLRVKSAGNDNYAIAFERSNSTTTIGGFYQNSTSGGEMFLVASNGSQNVKISSTQFSYWAAPGVNFAIGTSSDSTDKLRVAGTTFTNEIMTLLPEAESRSNINWRFGAASIASITPNRRLRVKVGGIEYYIGAVEV